MQGRGLAVVAAVLLAIGCRLEIRCATATPPRWPWSTPTAACWQTCAARNGCGWSRLIASAGETTFTDEARIERPGSTDPVVPAAWACAVQALPVDTYPLLNPSLYCATAALMVFAWTHSP